MFPLDVQTHRLRAQDRIDSLSRSVRIEAQPETDNTSADRQRRGGITPAPSPSRLRALASRWT
jgi:hypothetical protein